MALRRSVLQPYRNWGEISPQENMSLTLKGEKSFFLDWSSLFSNQFFWLGKSRATSYVKGHTVFVLEKKNWLDPLNMDQRNVLANPRFNRHHFGLNWSVRLRQWLPVSLHLQSAGFGWWSWPVLKNCASTPWSNDLWDVTWTRKHTT